MANPVPFSKTESAISWYRDETLRCRADFCYYLRNYVFTLDSQRGLGIQKFPDYQFAYDVAEEFQNNRLVVVLKSRQMMISWILAAFALWSALFYVGSEIPVISMGKNESAEVIRRATIIYDNMPDRDRIAPYAKISTYRITVPENKSRIMSFPCTKKSARSFSGSGAIVDEAAFLEHGTELFSAVKPVIGQTGWLKIVSTPNGRDGLFYPLWHNYKNNFHRIRLHWSIHPLRDQAWADREKAEINNIRMWLREYEMSFASPEGEPVYNYDGRQSVPLFKDKNGNQLWSKNIPILRGWDFGFRRPACLWAQNNNYDQLCCLYELMGNRTPKNKFIPKVINLSRAMFPGATFIDYVPSDVMIPDSEGNSWYQDMIKLKLDPVMPRKDDIKRRVSAVEDICQLRADSRYGLLVDPDTCETLEEGLKGGYHYPENIDKKEKEKPEKDGYYDHLANSLECIADRHYEVYRDQIRRERETRVVEL